MFYTGDNFCYFLFALLYISTLDPFWEGVYSKKIDFFFSKGVCSKSKEFAPKGSKFFPFIVDPFSEG